MSMTHGIVQRVLRQPEPANRVGLGVAVGAMALAVAPTATTLIALGLLGVLLALIGLDDRRPRARFTMHRPLVEATRYTAWRAWDDERDRWCILVSTTCAGTSEARAALAEARRVLQVGPAYDTEAGPTGPIWLFEA